MAVSSKTLDLWYGLLILLFVVACRSYCSRWYRSRFLTRSISYAGNIKTTEDLLSIYHIFSEPKLATQCFGTFFCVVMDQMNVVFLCDKTELTLCNANQYLQYLMYTICITIGRKQCYINSSYYHCISNP